MKAACMSPISGLTYQTTEQPTCLWFYCRTVYTIKCYTTTKPLQSFTFACEANTSHLTMDAFLRWSNANWMISIIWAFQPTWSPAPAEITVWLLGPARNGVAAVLQIVILLECRTVTKNCAEKKTFLHLIIPWLRKEDNKELGCWIFISALIILNS